MSIFHLPAFQDDFDDPVSQPVLPGLKPRFFIPQMLDKPQNPIMDTLKLHTPTAPAPTPSRFALSPELASLTFDPPPRLNDSIWTEALKGSVKSSEILSWDALRPNYAGRPQPSPFISEQENSVFAAARYHLQPPINDSRTEFKYVTQQTLLEALKMTVLGISSPLHIWDPASETFVQLVSEKGGKGVVLIDDKDEVVSASFIARFLTIGTLLRRLEILVASLRSKSGPTVHAFTHALSTVIVFLREQLAQSSPPNDAGLSKVWIQYEKYEEILTALAALTDRGKDNPPHNYLALDHSSVNLLSLLYDHLHSHIERQAPRMVTAILAFILTSTSREYFQQLSHLVGFSGDSTRKRSSRVVGEHNDQYAIDVSDDGIEERDEFDRVEDSFPTFFPPKLVDILPGAQKSLVLLRAAEPDHPLLRAPSARRVIEWFWSWDRIEAAWNGMDAAPAAQERTIPPTPHDTEPGLAQFRIFDLEPGSHLGHSILDQKHAPTPSSVLQDFIDAFPPSLPPITPTLEHLTSLVFEPLLQHASTLSRTLLSLFLSPSAPLQFKPHMELLHSYPLLASPAFKSRLAAALFSDSQGYDPDEPVPTSLRSLRRKAPIKQAPTQRWPVGLSWALLERETWPPVGADLSFFLRTVIVDSFDVSGEQSEDSSSRRGTFWAEAERRLGFAIRDLPTGPGHDQWLNPLSIEALDFLYMEYKPPHPLDILITPEILSKYQRMFTHLLRIMRVEHALSSVFRMCRTNSRPLFPTLVAANKRLLHLRFITHSFVSILSSYVFDTAIGGNVNPFLAQLDRDQGQTPEFPDVFALAKAHAALMDDVLTACLLRTAQRGAADLLRQALELVLEFAVLVGDVKTGRLQEYEAALMLEDLASRFRGRMGAFTRNLKAIVEKGPLPADSSIAGTSSGPQFTGGVQAVAHLSESLSDWWSTI